MHGISHLTSPPHTPEHNGFAERRHRHIVDTGLSLLTYASYHVFFGLMLLLQRSILLVVCLLLHYKIFHLMQLFFNIPRIMKNFVVLDVYVILGFARTLLIN
jgi:transposase InsO family protein